MSKLGGVFGGRGGGVWDDLCPVGEQIDADLDFQVLFISQFFSVFSLPCQASAVFVVLSLESPGLRRPEPGMLFETLCFMAVPLL